MVRFASPDHARPPARVGRWVWGAGAVLTIGIAVAAWRVARADAPYFFDSLTGPESPRLSIPAGKYGYTSQGLRRNQSVGRLDRPIVRTVSGGYLDVPRFRAEVSVNVAAGDTAFVGFGQAFSDPGHFNEPAHCFLFRVQNLADTRVDIAATQAGRETHFLDVRKVAVYLPGTTVRCRIVRDGDYVTLSIPSLNVSRTYSISQYNAQLGLTGENACLFFANTAVHTVFSDFRVSRLAPESEDASATQQSRTAGAGP